MDRRAPLCYSDNPDERRELTALFDSTDVLDHLTAKELCDVCPVREGCLKLAEDIRGAATWPLVPSGTWGGELYLSGRNARELDPTANRTKGIVAAVRAS